MKNKKNLKKIYLNLSIFLFLFILFSCGPSSSSSDEVKVEDKYLTSSELVDTKTKTDVIGTVNLAKLLGLNIDTTKITKDLEVYKIEYKTDYRGSQKIASALVYVPVGNSDSYSLLVYNHGTVANNAGAPTQQAVDSINNGIPYALSATGMIAVVPDYLGYGSSQDITHPYFIADVTASTIRDSISAAYEMLKKKSIKINNNLYATGYSEGGYATMVLHRSLEKDPLEPFNFKASMPAAGGYDIISFRDYVLGQTTYAEPFFLGFVLKAYKSYYDYDDGFYSKIVKAPFDSKIDSLIDGKNDSQTINSGLTSTINDLVTSAYKATPNDPLDFKEKMELNSPIDFVPQVKMIMYHGRTDTTVPYNNSITVKDKFLKAGAPDVTFKEVSGDHNSAIFPYVNGIFDDVLKLEGKK